MSRSSANWTAGVAPVINSVAVALRSWSAATMKERVSLISALPVESVQLFELALRANAPEASAAAQTGARAAADALYRWFLPLLTLDTVPKFVQLIKLVQQQVGQGHERVRAPRLVLEGAERQETLALIAQALATRPGNDA